MKRKTLRWIIGLMGLAMIGLISFQLYWIDNLITANEERFQKDVHDALNRVANKLEKQETIRAFDKLNYLSKVPTYDTVKRGRPTLQTADWNSPIKKNRLLEGTQQIFVMEDSVYGASVEFVFSVGAYDNYFFQNFNPNTPQDEKLLERDLRIQELEDKLAKVSRRYEQTFEVVNELMGSHRPLGNRFNPNQLDSLLKNELLSKGIDINYDYGVFQPRRSQFLYHLTKNTGPKELAQSELKASLFPNDLFGNESQLVISFPDKRGFLVRKVWSAMASSGVLVIVILFCFGYSIRTIVYQKKLSEMKNDFINNMTHELKTPISTVSLAVEALNDKEIERSALREKYINVIGEENKRLGDQVEKVLQIAAIDRNDFNLKEVLLSMKEMLQNAADHISIQVEQRGGRINLVDSSETDLVKGDELHITNIIVNLLDNANKYSPEAPNITLKADSDEDNFYLSIQDRGIGMTKEQQKHIFEKFYRVPTGDLHNVKGFGLGLAYVQKIVAAHGGSIDVDSEPGKGSKFSIKLPLAKNET